MYFSIERARAAAQEKYIKETDLMCELLKNKDVDGMKKYLENYEKQKSRYTNKKFHWTRSGAVCSLVNEMKKFIADCKRNVVYSIAKTGEKMTKIKILDNIAAEIFGIGKLYDSLDFRDRMEIIHHFRLRVNNGIFVKCQN